MDTIVRFENYISKVTTVRSDLENGLKNSREAIHEIFFKKSV